MAGERTGHLPSCAKAEKRKLSALHADYYLSGLLKEFFFWKIVKVYILFL